MKVIIVMTKFTLVRLLDWAGEELEKIAKRRGNPFATVVREIVVEYLNENAPGATSAKINEPGAATTSDKPEVAC